LRSEVYVEGLTDPHDLMWTGNEFIAVSSIHDCILWIGPDSRIRRRYQPAPGGDCWHLNSLTRWGGRLLASAFGRFETPRAWAQHLHEGTGFLFDVETGENILDKLYCPHTPRRLGDSWLVCNSSTSELVEIDACSKSPVRRATLQNWTRGLAFTDDRIFVGESVNRLQSEGTTGASIAVLDRASFELVGRIGLSFREVYDLITVQPELSHAVGAARAPQIVPRGL
jgi:acetolactate synthase I/II/III large subunit